MPSRNVRVGRPYVRNSVLATILLAVVYGLRAAAPLGTLLLAFDPLRVTMLLGRNVPDDLGSVLFLAELGLLGLVGTGAAYLVHHWATDEHRTGWRLGVAGTLGIVGLHWILWTIPFFGATHTDPVPVAITAVSGLLLFGVAGWLASSRV